MSARLRRAVARGVAALGLLSAACLDDRPVATEPNDESSPSVRVGFQATILGAAAGQTVRIRAYYLRLDGTDVTLESSPTEVSVTPGVPRQVAVVVRIAACLGDTQRAAANSNTCDVGIALTLEDETGTVIDEQSSPPSQPLPPGGTTTIGAPITFAPVSQVTFGAIPVFREGESRTLTASATDAQGNTLASRTFKWTSDNPTVLTVNSATGAATAGAVGSARVTVVTGIKSATTTVRVIRRVTSVVLGPDPAPPVRAAATLPLIATPKAANGQDAGDLADRAIVWSVVNPAGATRTATVSTNGTVTGVYPGDADVTVSIDGVTATKRLRVTAAGVNIGAPSTVLLLGNRLTMRATVVDANDVALPNVPVTWGTSNPAVATVDENGVVTAVAVGLAIITATGGGATGTAPIHVTSLNLNVRPVISEILAGNTSQLTASDAIGPVTWATSTPSIATVSADGLVTARVPGTAVITATSVSSFGTQQGTATVIVKAASLEIIPASAVIYEGETFQFTAIARDTKGAVLDVAITWSSGNPQLAPISATGLVVGSGVVVTTVGAVGGGQQASASLTILDSSDFFVAPRAGPRRGSVRAPTPPPGN